MKTRKQSMEEQNKKSNQNTLKQSIEEQKKNSDQNLAGKSEPTEGEIKTTVEPSNNSDINITKALGHDRKHTMLGVTASEIYTGSSVSRHELFLYLLLTVLSASVCYLHFQLRGFEGKFEEINSHIDYLEMLKQIKAAVPEIQQKIFSSNEQTGTALIRVKELEDWTKLAEKRLNDTKAAIALATADMRNIETKSTDISNSNDKLKTELENESKNIESLKDKVKGLELESIQKQISELKKRAEDTERELIPSIEKQEALVKSIQENEDKVKTLITSVNTCESRMSDVESKMKANKENFEKVNYAVEQAHQLNLTITYMAQNVSDGVTMIKDFKEKVGQAESSMTNLTQELSLFSTNITESKNALEQLEGRQQKTTEILVTADERALNLTRDLENIQSDVVKFKGTVSVTEQDISKRVITIKDELSTAEQRMTTLKEEYNNSILSLTERIEKEENFTKHYIEQTLPALVARVESHINNVSTPWISVIGIVDILLIAVLFYLWFKPALRYLLLARDDSPTRSEAHNERPHTILEQIHRPPVLDNKICILSFYAETQTLHRTLVNSALESCRRGRTIEVVAHLVKTHRDILNIPRARYIFVFVDYNERNIILENPDQDLGNKKLVSVQACQKLGADVFVTYVRDKGSSNLFPGHLYNPDLSAFTRHETLKTLESDQKCFSVYEHFSTAQKEQIARKIG